MPAMKTAPIFFLAAFLLSAPDAFCKVVKEKNLKRQYDVVLIRGDVLKRFLGEPVDKLRLYSFKDGAFQAVPFQVDERDARNNYVVDEGRDKGKDEPPGILDGNDEFVFMAWDSGNQVSMKEFPAGITANAEIEVRDPDTDESAFVYLLLFESPPPLSPLDYVRYDAEKGVVNAYYYAVKYSEDAPLVFDSLYTKKQIGGDETNMIDRLKIRFRAKLPLGIKLDKSEEDFKTTLMGYKDGPVRLIRRAISELTIFGIFKAPSAVGHEYFYGNYFYIPIEIEFPFDVKDIFSEAAVRLTTELAPESQTVYYNSNNPEPVAIDGKMSEEEKSINKEPFTWAVIQNSAPGNTTAFFNVPIFRGDGPVKPYLYYMDDDASADAPENYPGQHGNLGYELNNFQWLKKGVHRLGNVLYALPDFKPGDEGPLLNALAKPLKIWVGKTVQLPD